MLCCAVFLGAWSPMTSRAEVDDGAVARSSATSLSPRLEPLSDVSLLDSEAVEETISHQHVIADPYTTPTCKSNVLLLRTIPIRTSYKSRLTLAFLK